MMTHLVFLFPNKLIYLFTKSYYKQKFSSRMYALKQFSFPFGDLVLNLSIACFLNVCHAPMTYTAWMLKEILNVNIFLLFKYIQNYFRPLLYSQNISDRKVVRWRKHLPRFKCVLLKKIKLLYISTSMIINCWSIFICWNLNKFS